MCSSCGGGPRFANADNGENEPILKEFRDCKVPLHAR